MPSNIARLIQDCKDADKSANAFTKQQRKADAIVAYLKRQPQRD